MLSADQIALQLQPEHRLFTVTFVSTRGDRGVSLNAIGKANPPQSIKKRAQALLKREDVMRYLYALLCENEAALNDFRGLPEWVDYIDEVMRRGGSGDLEKKQPPMIDPKASEPGSDVIPIEAAKNAPSVKFSSEITLGDPTPVQQYLLHVIFDDMYANQAYKLRACDMYLRSVGAYDSGADRSKHSPIRIVPLTPENVTIGEKVEDKCTLP